MCRDERRDISWVACVCQFLGHSCPDNEYKQTIYIKFFLSCLCNINSIRLHGARSSTRQESFEFIFVDSQGGQFCSMLPYFLQFSTDFPCLRLEKCNRYEVATAQRNIIVKHIFAAQQQLAPPSRLFQSILQ